MQSWVKSLSPPAGSDTNTTEVLQMQLAQQDSLQVQAFIITLHRLILLEIRRMCRVTKMLVSPGFIQTFFFCFET